MCGDRTRWLCRQGLPLSLCLSPISLSLSPSIIPLSPFSIKVGKNVSGGKVYEICDIEEAERIPILIFLGIFISLCIITFVISFQLPDPIIILARTAVRALA
eukprot:sb/3478366/